MTATQIAARGVRSPRVLEAMRRVPREAFVPDALRARAYDDHALPIGEGQTISQPYIVARMIEALELGGDETVLEVGTGSGYAAAILGELSARVCTLERLGGLARTAAQRLADLGYDNVRVIQTDGSIGWPDAAPYDAIVVAAASPVVPEVLREQLAPGGRLIVPVGSTDAVQELVRVRRVGPDEFAEDFLGGVRFVPLVDSQGSTRASE
jgi:protein-L-isoaspartate(D-aspartate) O-methyltransferase